MRILFIDVDKTDPDTIKKNALPNLALMKLSAWHRNKGDICILNALRGQIDKIYMSTVFNWHRGRALSVRRMYEALGYEVVSGGYAVDKKRNLPYEIEHIMPDYDLYGVDYSVGFTSRGCIRNCEFCIVREKEGYIKDWATISEFLRDDHKKLILIDNNLFAAPKCLDTLNDIISVGVETDFNQGLDIRLVNEEKAKLLAEVKLIRALRFAFDLPQIQKSFIKGMSILKDNGVKMRDIMVYVLIGKDTTFEEDMMRFKTIKDFGAHAYPMVYRPPDGRPDGVVPENGDRATLLKSVGHMPTSSFFQLMHFYSIYDPKDDRTITEIMREAGVADEWFLSQEKKVRELNI